MSIWRKRLQLRFFRGFGRASVTKIVVLSFTAMILLGAGLLALPAASRSGQSAGFLPALFTATSATCVTGLVLFDTFTQWSGFGQIVILLLIQLGGLGFMSVVSVYFFALRKKVGLKQRIVMAQALSLDDMQGVVRLERHVLLGTFLIEGTGAGILFLRLAPRFGLWNGLKWGIFHAVSAFCNAGFDLFGCLTPGASLMEFGTDPVILLTLSVLIILGGLGFFVWEDVAQKRRFREFSIYTKLVLTITLAALLSGWFAICALEWRNPATLGKMSVPQKLLAGWFQSVTLRTAGFAGFDQAGLTEPGKAVSILIMLIGGSSGSTAGGLKTVTVGVLMLAMAARLRGRRYVTAYKRTIPDDQVGDALTLTLVMTFLCFVGGIVLSAFGVPFLDALFETTSALATVGLSAGVTPGLNGLCQLLLIFFMFFGRVGVMTISLAFFSANRAEGRYQYAKTKLLIG